MLKVGDTQSFLLKSPVATGKALVVVEKDDGILDYFVHDLTSYADTLTIPVKATYYPNFYTKVFLLGAEDKNPLPVYKRALAITKVSTDDKKLDISVSANKARYLPGEKVHLTIKAAPYANGSIAIVDESLLALKGNPVKNPYAFFYDIKRYLGVQTYSDLANLIDKLEIKDASNGSK